MQPDGILETVLYAEDLAAAEAFYTRHFGLQVVRRVPGRFVFLRCGGQMLLIFDPRDSARPDPDNPIPRHGASGPGHVCFRVADGAAVQAWRDRLAAAGVAIEHDHLWPGGARSVYLRDPAGTSVEIGEPRMWGL
ncbi:VOC family protein [Frigidibacter oleivorans]|uniref:VOC family protein n=1 Tax=Frigidibacter oleivorans TaxID=2487129 RepID=UPI000F8EACFD|nr:VOC family protein [Frigidibacter oleivorans]